MEKGKGEEAVEELAEDVAVVALGEKVEIEEVA